jgi:hypothetical protein
VARTVFKIAEVVARRLVGSIPTRSRQVKTLPALSDLRFIPMRGLEGAALLATPFGTQKRISLRIGYCGDHAVWNSRGNIASASPGGKRRETGPSRVSEANRPAATASFKTRLADRSGNPVILAASPRSNSPRMVASSKRRPPTTGTLRPCLKPCDRTFREPTLWTWADNAA